jgi:glycosyltransferase involved in cell wall biosynthesis
MRILMVNDMAIESGWGAESHVARLVDGLRAQGDTVEVFAGEVEHQGAARALDVWDPFARRTLRARAHAFGPDVIHYHNVLRELSVSVLGVSDHLPSVLTVHEHRLLGVPDSPPRGPRGLLKIPLAWFHRRVVRRRVDVVLGVSKEMTNELRAAGFPAAAHMPQFAADPPRDLERVPVARAHDVVIASRLTPEKGVRELTEAYMAVADRHPESRLVVAGEGPEEAVVLAAQRRLGPDRVRVLGRLSLDAVQSLFAAARVVVVPSVYREGSPTTPIEAALVGRPVIVTDEPGLREFVDESGGGIVVARGSVPELATALDQVLGDGAFAERLGDAGRAYAVENRTVSAVLPVVRSFYERAVEQRRSSAPQS